MDFQRFFLFIALALVLMLIWQAWLEEQQPGTLPTEIAETGSDAPSIGDELPQTPSVEQTEVATASAAVPDEPQDSGETVVVETDLLRAEIDTRGGDLRRVALLHYPVSIDEPDVPFVLLNKEPGQLYVAQGGLIGGDYPNHQSEYQVEQKSVSLSAGADKISVPLTWEGPDGVRYQKVYTFHRDSYVVDVEYHVDNRTDDSWLGFQYAQFVRIPPPTKGGFFGRLPSYTGGAIYTPEERYEKVKFDDMEEQNLSRRTASGWVAMLQHYFVGAWLPQPDQDYELYSNVLQRSGGPQYVIGYKTLQPTRVGAGATGSLATQLYLGPKEQDRLNKQAEGLVLTVDYGWLTPISSPLFWVLRHIQKVVKNWGWSIVLLTCLIKLIFYPLSAASYKSMAKMKTMQPRLKTLKERYGDDKQKLNQAMMEMYKKEKINPLGGCLPIVIQIPVFIALYWALLESVELRQADFFLWINDLSLPDPFYVLPILMGASMLGQQFLNPAPLDPIQKNIMMAMPVVFTVFFLWFPAGLVLYWLTNNVLSIAQQWFITRKITAAKTN